MKSVWYFVGILLTVIGAILTVNGVYQAFSPPVHKPRLSELHAGIWWGAVILVAGILFLVTNRNKTVD
ncbi:MAG: hypothetical protein WBD22_14790 [Pyrinomonadaceae bacterium]